MRSLSGSLQECFPPLRLDLKVGFALYLLVQISAKLVSLESPYLSSFLLHMYYVSTNLVDLPEMVIFSVGLPSIRNIVNATFEGCISCSIRSIPVAPSAPHLLPILKKPAQHSGRRTGSVLISESTERPGCTYRPSDPARTVACFPTFRSKHGLSHALHKGIVRAFIASGPALEASKEP